MSFPTTSALIHSSKGWDETTRSHPALKWFEGYARAVDSGEIWKTEYSKWHTEDFSYQKATGEEVTGGAAAFEALKETYLPFDGNNHEPKFLCCWEIEGGYEMIGQATIFGNLKAPGGSGKVFQDLEGKKWDIKIPGAFHFTYAKVGDAFKLKRTEICSDSGPAVVEMLKRGMLKPEQLMG